MGFLGIANLLAFFLEKYPDPSVCLFIGLITGMLPSLFGRPGRREGAPAPGSPWRYAWCLFSCCWSACLAERYDHPEFRLVSVLRLLPGAERDRSGHELFHAADASRPVHALCGRDRPSGFRRPDPGGIGALVTVICLAKAVNAPVRSFLFHRVPRDHRHCHRGYGDDHSLLRLRFCRGGCGEPDLYRCGIVLALLLDHFNSKVEVKHAI